jgi:hypothetical protein
MKTLYQADDGKIFDNYSDCYDYEAEKTKKTLPGFIQDSFLYDKNGKLITQEKFLECRGSNVYYADIRTQKDSDWLDIMTDEEYALPNDIGMWYYDSNIDGGVWMDYDELKDEYDKRTKVFSQNKKEG